jgi:6-phosphogluconolactonase
MLPEVRVYPIPEELAKGAAEEFIRTAQASIAVRGRFLVALSGGTTPKRTFEHISRRGNEVDGKRIHVFWADERHVPADDPQSNSRLARNLLLPRLAIPETNVHQWRTELAPEQASRDYEETLSRVFGALEMDCPSFDFVFLGVGLDGHTASIFPGTPALEETRRWAIANEVRQGNGWRLTLTLPVLNAAREAVFLAEGSGKAGIVHRALQGASELPASRVRARRTVWILDQAAAGGA